MDDSEKPFACPSPGCNMSFTNEDHLVVHKKKHDMVLNLGSNGKTTFVADQTPTPTRFIRNCEEVGLFQDLQHVNPFEETFRRAVEAGKTGSLSDSEVNGVDDTLHTPHIFPIISEEQSSIVVSADKNEEQTSQQERNVERAEEKPAETLEDIEIVSEKAAATIGVPEPSAASKIMETIRATPNLSINGQEVQLLLKTADGKLLQLSAVPIADNRKGNDGETVGRSSNLAEKKLAPESRLTAAKMRLKEALTRNGSTKLQTSTASVLRQKKVPEDAAFESVNADVQRKQDVQARNRASSIRARAKRKAWIQQLQRSAANANERNALLQSEVKALRCEVAKLRALLLVHNDCPVTKAMGKVSTGPEVAAKSSPEVETLDLTGDDNRPSRRKRSKTRSEPSIAPKIPKWKHHAILPKTDLPLNDPLTFKITDVRSLPIESQKRIIIVQTPTPPPRRLEIVRASPRQFFQTSPSTQPVENAASKCTAT